MTDQRLPYSDAESLPAMAVDAHEVEHNMRLPRRVDDFSGGLLAAPQTPASARVHTRYDVPDDLAEMVDGMGLHFD